MGRIEFDFTFYVWYRSEENSSNVNRGAMGDVVVVIRVDGDLRISLNDNENLLFTCSKISDTDISHSLQLEVAAHWRASSIHFETNMKK